MSRPCLLLLAFAAAAGLLAAAADYQVLTDTYLSAGADLENATLTVADAEARCDSLAACRGFTYSSSSGAGPAFAMFLKSAISTGAGAGWVSYIKREARLLSATFSSSLVLQHDAPCLWGYGGNVTGAAVTVATDADGGAPHATTVAANNSWRLCLPPMPPAGGPWTVNVSVAGVGSQLLADVLFGEVWLASGQSNAAFTVAQSVNASAECAAAASFTRLRVMSVTQGGSPVPLADLGPEGVRLPWSRASAATVCGGDFDYVSAVGWFFARDLQLALGAEAMPVGLIVSAVPGTSIEAWAPPQVFADCGVQVNNSQLYNGMIAPILDVSIRGAVWYQGESDEAQESYRCTFPGMISAWRRGWRAAPSPGALGFPFLFVQLSPYMDQAPYACLAEGGPGLPAYSATLPRARLRQTAALALPNVGMASAVDLADHASPFWPGSVHPRWKQPIGWRLSLEARRLAYGEAGLVSRGPQLRSVTGFSACDLDYSCGSYHEKDAVVLRLAFDSAGGGLSVITFAALNFVATFANATNASAPVSCRVPCSIVPTSVVGDALDVYCTYQQYCLGVALDGAFDALGFDMPVVAVFNSAGLPMEPFSVNITAPASLPKGGTQLWP